MRYSWYRTTSPLTGSRWWRTPRRKWWRPSWKSRATLTSTSPREESSSLSSRMRSSPSSLNRLLGNHMVDKMAHKHHNKHPTYKLNIQRTKAHHHLERQGFGHHQRREDQNSQAHGGAVRGPRHRWHWAQVQGLTIIFFTKSINFSINKIFTKSFIFYLFFLTLT